MKNTNSILFSFLFLSTIAVSQSNTKNLEASLNNNKTNNPVSETKEDALLLVKSSEMLDEDLYWSIIEKSRLEHKNQEDQEVFLSSEIEKLSPKDIIGFRLRTDKLLFDTYNSELWCAAYIMNGGCSDAGFDYFRCWLISKGKDVFYKAKSNPDSLISEVEEGKTSYEFEGFWFVAMNAFLNKTDQEIYSYIDYENFTTNDENYPLIDFNWNVDNPQSMEKVCPLLYKKMWK
jgi:hypothetical protein